MTYLPQIRILVPSAQVSSYTTGSFNLPSARGAFYSEPSSRGIFAGGFASSKSNVIDYINIKTLGNATDFGDLGLDTNLSQGGGSSTRGVIVRGYTGTSPEISSAVMDYITIATTGNATNFGNRTIGAGSGASASNAITMVSVSYQVSNPRTNDYITIATTGNSTSWGATWDTASGDENACTASSSTRGLFAGGYKNSPNARPTEYIQYLTYATTGTIDTFGNLQNNGYSGRGGASNGVRAVFKNDFSNVTLDYVTIATTGNASDFGDLSFSDYNLGQGDCSNGTKGVFAGGRNETNVIQYITINTTGNTLDFGDLTVGRNGPACTSDGHGGL